MKFHEFVTSRRVKLNFNKKELAKKAKISDAYIKHIEDGIRIPKDMIILYNLADALQVDREWFRDFAYLNRDHQKAVSYIDEQKVFQTRNNGNTYNTANSLSSKEKEFLALFRKADEEGVPLAEIALMYWDELASNGDKKEARVSKGFKETSDVIDRSFIPRSSAYRTILRFLKK